ncbi:MAG: YceI family protein [Pseudomonadota bacterium]
MKTIVFVSTLFFAAQANAESHCYIGNQSSGELNFRSAVEGSGFSGGFGEFQVRYCMPQNQPDGGEIVVEVAMASADTDNRDRDEALLGPEFFDVEQFPTSSWTSEAISIQGDRFSADGRLNLRGIEASVPVQFQIDNAAGDTLTVRGQFQMTGQAEINRQDFSVGTGEFADPEFVRNRVDVNFSIELSLAKE